MINQSKIKKNQKSILNNLLLVRIRTMLFVAAMLFANNNVSHNLFAQQNLTLDEAIKIGIENSSELKQAKLDIKKAEATVSEVFGNALPSLDFTASFSHTLKGQQVAFPDLSAIFTNAAYQVLFNENLIPFDNSKLVPAGTSLLSMQQKNNFQTQFQLTQILFNSAVFTGIGVSKDYLEISKAQYNAKRADIVMNIKNAFYGVLFTREMLDIVNLSFQNAQENLNNVMALAQEGLVAEFTTLEARVRVENIKPQIRQMENTVTTATDGLKILLGMSPTSNINVTGTINYQDENLPETETLIRRANDNNLNIKILEQVTQVNKAAVRVSESDYYPTLAGFANYGYNGMSNTFSDFQSFPTSMVGISFSMNLFRGLQTKYKVQQSQIDVIKTEEQIQQLKDAITMQVRTNANELVRIKEEIVEQTKNVELAERAQQLAGIRFREGTGSQLEIINSDLALSIARTNRLESIYNYIVSKARLDNLLGQP